MGGSWERLIRTVRSVLSVLLQEHGSQLDDEALRTLMTEAENVINSRPLTVENLSDHDSLEALTPNHLLTSKTDVVLPPPCCFERLDSSWRISFGYGGAQNIPHSFSRDENGIHPNGTVE